MKNHYFLVLMLCVIATNAFAHVKKYQDGTVVVAMTNSNGEKATQGVRVVYPNKNVYVGTISLSDIKDGQQENNDVYPYKRVCGYELDNTGSTKYYLSREEVLPHATEALLCSKKWCMINSYHLKELIYTDYTAKDLLAAPTNLMTFSPIRINEKWQFNADHTGKASWELASSGYCNQLRTDAKRAVGSNQYVTKYQSYASITGGYTFTVSAPVSEDFTWTLKNDTINVVWKKVNVGKYIVTPNETCSDCSAKQQNEWKEYVRVDCQTNYEIHQIKKKYLKEYVDNRVAKLKEHIGHTYTFPITAVNSKCIVIGENAFVLRAPDAKMADLVDWFGFYKERIVTNEPEDCGFEEDKDGNYTFYIAGEKVYKSLSDELICNTEWRRGHDTVEIRSNNYETINLGISSTKYHFNPDSTGYYCTEYTILDQCAPDKGGYKYKISATIYTDFKWQIIGDGKVLFFEEDRQRGGFTEIIPDVEKCESCSSEKDEMKWKKKLLKACEKDAFDKNKRSYLRDLMSNKKQYYEALWHKFTLDGGSKNCIFWGSGRYLDIWYAPEMELNNPVKCADYFHSIVAY